MKIKLLFILIATLNLSFSQNSNFIEQDISINKNIDGTLLTPKTEKPPLVILIAGSGPLDRNGNSNFAKNNSLKRLAIGLANRNIATFRYDKRVFKQIKERNIDDNMTFEDFIEDARATLSYFKSKSQFGNIYILGHSQGSLVGMIAAKDKADGFISLAGPAETIDKTIIRQIELSTPMFIGETKRLFGILKEGKTTDDYPPALAPVFNKESQPFIISWMRYNPQEEIKKLAMPVLIINGTTDMQITEEDARLLYESASNSKLVVIDKMNHVLVPIEAGTLENYKSYNEAFRKLSPELIEVLAKFIK